MNLNNLLQKLKIECTAPDYSRNGILLAIQNIIVWLLQPNNDIYTNYKHISLFVASEILCTREFERIPPDIQDVLHDIGSSLDQVFTNPEIAENFYSTPQQLLKRIQEAFDNS